MDLETAQNTTTTKFPILKQENGNSFKPAAQTTTNADGISTSLIPGPYNDVKTLFAVIQTRFGGFRRLNKPDLDTMSFDDLYNNFKIVEQEVKGTASLSSISSSQNMIRQGKDFLGTMTPLFATMLIQSQAVEGKGSGQPTEPQHIPTTASPSHVEPIPIVASSSQPKRPKKHRKTKRKATEISQSSRPTTLVADETVHEERGDSVEKDAITATSLDVELGSGNINRTQSTTIPNDPFPKRISSGGSPRCQEAMRDTIAQTRSKRVSIPSYDSPLPGVNTPGSDEE
ncbi:hypothetical protein Tco_1545627 [Tanacetum coccineum]